ncbi:MAG: hypothetical protein ACI81P_002822 [Neolewinella sp.]|jgi:hypothetical protein
MLNRFALGLETRSRAASNHMRQPKKQSAKQFGVYKRETWRKEGMVGRSQERELPKIT